MKPSTISMSQADYIFSCLNTNCTKMKRSSQIEELAIYLDEIKMADVLGERRKKK